MVEKLKVSLIELSFDKWIHVSNTQNENFYGLTYDGDQRLITGQQIYHVNDDIVERLNNGLIFYVCNNWM